MKRQFLLTTLFCLVSASAYAAHEADTPIARILQLAQNSPQNRKDSALATLGITVKLPDSVLNNELRRQLLMRAYTEKDEFCAALVDKAHENDVVKKKLGALQLTLSLLHDISIPPAIRKEIIDQLCRPSYFTALFECGFSKAQVYDDILLNARITLQ